jgi:hypothetical protein
MRYIILILLLITAPLAAQKDLDGAAILARATETAGGDDWANAKSLILQGRAVFWGPDGAKPRAIADNYTMWRVFDPNRIAAHGAEGKVRITIKAGERLISDVGFNGNTTWTEKGVTPQAEADAFWANNFGFGIIRHARKPGFKAQRVADDVIDGHQSYMVRLIDPAGQVSLFGIDAKSFAIRRVGFSTPRGWHVRTYDDFMQLKNPRWLQARKVTLTYNGVKQNELHWQHVEINPAIDDALFDPPKAP